MDKIRKILVPDDLSKLLGVSEEKLNEKNAILMERRANLSEEEMFTEIGLAEDYLELFSKEEMIALFLQAASNAGFMEWKLLELIDKLDIPLDEIRTLMSTDVPSKEDIASDFKEAFGDSKKEDESFL